MTRNWWSLVVALMLDRARGALVRFPGAARGARAHVGRPAARRMCKQKYAAWKSQKEPGKGLEVGRVVPKWLPGDDYCTLFLERVGHAAASHLFVQTVKCRGSCERGPNAAPWTTTRGSKSSSKKCPELVG